MMNEWINNEETEWTKKKFKIIFEPPWNVIRGTADTNSVPCTHIGKFNAFDLPFIYGPVHFL